MNKIKDRLRIDFQQKIRPLFIGGYCEKCSTKENLHLHHASKKFTECANEVSKFIKFDLNDDISTVDEDSLEFIRSAMLGIQLRIEYRTLCRQCHFDEHRDDKKGQGNTRLLTGLKKTMKIRRQNEINHIHTTIKDFMEANSYKEIPFQNKSEICKLFDKSFITGSERLLGKKSISDYLQNNGLKYTIVSKEICARVNKKQFKCTVWIIKELDDYGNIIEKEVEKYDMKGVLTNEN